MFSPWIRALFVLSGIYDGVLGIAFLLFGPVSRVTPDYIRDHVPANIR